MKDGIIGFAGGVGTLVASVGVRDEVSAWVSLICSLSIALVTCGIQIWRMIRDRNADKKKKSEAEKGNEE